MKRADSSWWDNVKSSVKQGWKDFNDYADQNQWVRPTIGALALGGTGFGLGSIWGRKAAIIAGLLSAATGGTTGYLFNPTDKKTSNNKTDTQPKKQPQATPTTQQVPQTQQSTKPENQKPESASPTQASMSQVSANLNRGKKRVLSPGQEVMLYDVLPATTMAGGYMAGGVYDNLKAFNRNVKARNLVGNLEHKGKAITPELSERFLRRYLEKSLMQSLTRPTKGHSKSIGSVAGLFLGAIPSLFAPSPYRQVQ